MTHPQGSTKGTLVAGEKKEGHGEVAHKVREGSQHTQAGYGLDRMANHGSTIPFGFGRLSSLYLVGRRGGSDLKILTSSFEPLLYVPRSCTVEKGRAAAHA